MKKAPARDCDEAAGCDRGCAGGAAVKGVKEGLVGWRGRDCGAVRQFTMAAVLSNQRKTLATVVTRAR